MKKLLAFAAAAVLSFSALATPFSFPSPIPKVHVSRASLQLLNHFGWGFHAFGYNEDPAFDAHTSFGRNREIFFNLFQLEVYPSSFSSISLGADLNWDTYRLSDTWFWLPDKEKGSVEAVRCSDYGYYSVKKATLRTFGFDIPLDFTYTYGRMDITLGVAAELNFLGRTKFKGIRAEDSVLEKHTTSGTRYRSTNVKTNTATMNVHLMVTYSGLGLYAKYCPLPQFSEGYGPQFTTWTVGLLLR